MDLIFATGNMHKLEEMRQILGTDFVLKTPSDFGITEEIPEDADTLEGNALQKARYIWDKTGGNCFADDTGLFVDALGGAPGVYSARYAGIGKKPEDNIRKLLGAMAGKTDRSARFVCVIALILNGEEHLFKGMVEGRIAEKISGAGGFGYDPVFLPEEYGGLRSFSELSHEEKNAISHRGRALKNFTEFMKDRR